MVTLFFLFSHSFFLLKETGDGNNVPNDHALFPSALLRLLPPFFFCPPPHFFFSLLLFSLFCSFLWIREGNRDGAPCKRNAPPDSRKESRSRLRVDGKAFFKKSFWPSSKRVVFVFFFRPAFYRDLKGPHIQRV